VNSYGAFGSVGKVRHEIVFEGTADPLGPGARWLPYEFNCKPGDPDRRPCWISPYHYRLDWQIWFAAMGEVSDEPWTVHMVSKLLRGDPRILGLLASNPFPDRPPRYIRAQLYAYRYAPLGSHAWWERDLVGEWLPPLGLEDPRLNKLMAAFGWR
jgi:Lipase maturation factor